MRVGVTAMITDRSIRPDELGREIEAHGFHAFYVPEHTHIPASRATPAPMGEPLPEPYWRLYDPFVALTAAALATDRIRLGTGIALLAERDPIATAKAVASLDDLSGGRVTLGIGFGWNREEMADHGVDFAQRREVTRDRLRVMRTLWADTEDGYTGDHARVAPSRAWPKPVQPRLPVWLGAGLGPKSLAFLVAECDGWIPIGGSGLSTAIPRLRAALEEAGRDPDAFPVVPFGSVPDAGKLEYFASLGIDEVVVNLPDTSRDGALRFLDDTAAELTRVARPDGVSPSPAGTGTPGRERSGRTSRR
jgi:probable F420-dependent oxidoreductase